MIYLSPSKCLCEYLIMLLTIVTSEYMPCIALPFSMYNFTTCAINLPFEDLQGGKKMDLEEETLLDYTIDPIREGIIFYIGQSNPKAICMKTLGLCSMRNIDKQEETIVSKKNVDTMGPQRGDEEKIA